MAYYFVADTHLGLSFRKDDPREREHRFVQWLDDIADDCEGLFLAGDIFDFWFEYKRVVPRGFVRTLGRLAAFCDRGIPVHFFVGNHDLWVSDYFEKEIGITVHLKPEVFELQGRRIFVAHGDGLGQVNNWRYKVLKRLFGSLTLRHIVTKFVHPNAMVRLGQSWSTSNRHSREGGVTHTFRGEGEPIVWYARRYAAEHPGAEPDYFVCGHIHTAARHPLDDRSTVVILGEWIESPAIARLENGVLELLPV